MAVWLSGDEFGEVSRLSCVKSVVRERDNFAGDAFADFQTVQRL